MRAKIEASSRFTNFSRVSNIVELGNRNMKQNFLNRIFFYTDWYDADKRERIFRSSIRRESRKRERDGNINIYQLRE